MMNAEVKAQVKATQSSIYLHRNAHRLPQLPLPLHLPLPPRLPLPLSLPLPLPLPLALMQPGPPLRSTFWYLHH